MSKAHERYRQTTDGFAIIIIIIFIIIVNLIRRPLQTPYRHKIDKT